MENKAVDCGYSKDPYHKSLVICNKCRRKFNILNIEGHLKWENEEMIRLSKVNSNVNIGNKDFGVNVVGVNVQNTSNIGINNFNSNNLNGVKSNNTSVVVNDNNVKLNLNE